MLMHRVVENMGATELRKKYDLLPLFFWRLAGGAELLLEDDIIYEIKMRCAKISEVASKVTGSPKSVREVEAGRGSKKLQDMYERYRISSITYTMVVGSYKHKNKNTV